MQNDRKKILLTGGSGFLGRIVCEAMSASGFEVKTLGRSLENDIRCDLSNTVPTMEDEFDIVVHNAGKAHVVPKTERQIKEFHEVNVQGTRNLLKSLESKRPRSIVFISSIAVYGLTSGTAISEDHPLLAKDPYGKSKIDAERIIGAWCEQRSVLFCALRLPLLAGPNPPGNLGAMIRGIQSRKYMGINGSVARKSIVLAGDVASIIPTAAGTGGIFNLTDGYHPSFRELENVVAKQLNVRTPFNLPLWLARVIGYAGDALDKFMPGRAPVTSRTIEKITSTLTFDDTKARTELGWKPHAVKDAFTIG